MGKKRQVLSVCVRLLPSGMRFCFEMLLARWMQADNFFYTQSSLSNYASCSLFLHTQVFKTTLPCAVRIEVVKILSGAGNIVAAERKEWLSFLMNACVKA